jgi:CubicO group peptidase (beta-lactamase class C family)
MLASVTKTFTALAAQQLAEAGALNLDAPLQAYIPEFRLADPEAAAAITVRHLLDHTSGISTLEGTQPYVHDADTSFAEALERLARYRPQRSPGGPYEYSNLNYVLLGEVVARASGQPYTEYMQAHIFDPLEMTGATFADYHTLPGAATGNLISFGLRQPYDEPHIPLMLSAGYLTASAEDMAHYLIPYLNQGRYEGRSLLQPQGEGWYDSYWNWNAGTPPDIAPGHSGGHDSINTDLRLFVLHKVGVVVLMNTRLDTLFPAPNAYEIAFNLARMVSGFPYETPSGRDFYRTYALIDGALLLMAACILWQVSRLRGWSRRYRGASPGRRLLLGAGAALNLLAAAGLYSVPALNDSAWPVLLSHRADIAFAVLGLCVLFAALGGIKVGLMALPEGRGREGARGMGQGRDRIGARGKEEKTAKA